MEMQEMVAIVTGSSRGIGKGIARAFGHAGARVVVVARTETEGRLPGTIYQTAEEIKAAGGEALPVKCDVTEEEQVQAMVQKVKDAYGRIDVLVNNAGVQVNVPIVELPTRHWDLTMRVNLRGPFLTCKSVLPVMLEQRRGNIINITSGGGETPRPRGVSYGVTKAGLNLFTRGLALEVQDYGIAVNALNPGPVKTEGAVFVRPKDFDWSAWDEPDAVGPATVWLARQTDATFTGRVVNRTEFGVTWP
ncbi:MAG: SDR family oxidoreductase [Chloroflexi bacterium]|nr:SDR family oxidoreductase [Chloroflexota bacterium]